MSMTNGSAIHWSMSDIELWTKQMFRMQARVPIVARLTGQPSGALHHTYRVENSGRSSPSGQSASKMEWFLETPTRQYLAAVLAHHYLTALDHMDARVAFADAFYHLSHLLGADVSPQTYGYGVGSQVPDSAVRDRETDYSIPFTRAALLMSHMYDQKGRPNPTSTVTIRRCRKCTSAFLDVHMSVAMHCPVCAKHAH